MPWRSLHSLASCHGDGSILNSGRCCTNFRLALRYSRLMRNPISLARKVTITQDYKAVSGIVGRFFTHQTMNGSAGNDGASQAGGFQAGNSGSSRGGYNRFRGRGRYVSHGGVRPVRPQSSRDEYRDWLHAKTKPPNDHERFVIASYNVLADQNAQEHWRELYWHIPPFIMNWDARKRKLLWELGLWSPDIICLQEVDRYEDFNEGLQESGYVGVYTRRTGETRDGCAMFWRKNRFELLELESIYFKDHNLRDNVAQLCVLQTKSKPLKRSDTEDTDDREPTTGSCDFKNNRVVVGNVHVLFNSKRGDVKLGQTRMLLEKAHAISQKWGNAPVAIAGDFNSTPGSALYQFISSSQLDLAFHDRREISGQEGEGQNGYYRSSGYSNKASRHHTASGPFQEVEEAKAEAGAERGAEGGTEAEAESETEAGAEAGAEAGVESETEAETKVEAEASAEDETEVRAAGETEARAESETEAGAEIGAEARAKAGSEEKPLLDLERSIVSLEIIDTEESILVTTGEGDLVTEIIQQKASRVTLETVYTPNRIRWFEDELMAATGGRNLTVVQHKLKLRSAYSEIEGKPGTRDERGEPFITTFHKKFRGTVDYIWHTDDLCTVKVLDTLPTFVLERCRGLPSKKWGSDHMALACEFSFVPREDTRQNSVSRETESE